MSLSTDTDKKIIYYYQTLSTLDNLIKQKLKNVHVYISSIHFGLNKDNSLYIHLNDSSPSDQKDVWVNLKKASESGITILAMIGGAGGGFKTLFSNYNKCYALLKEFISTYPFIQGIDLDIEEEVDIKDVKRLITDIATDFGRDFIITLAPIQSALMVDGPGLGGFSYKELFQSDAGKFIHWFNVQAYYNYSIESYEAIVSNGYDASQLVYGVLGDSLIQSYFPEYLNETSKVVKAFPNMGGVFVWEFGDIDVDPIVWGCQVYNRLYPWIDYIKSTVVYYLHHIKRWVVFL